MGHRFTCWSLVAAFALAVGHVAWHAQLGPPPAPEYFVDGSGKALRAPHSQAKQLYLRHKFYLTRRPDRAWIEVAGRDRIRVYLNGQLVDSEILDGYPVAVVVDLAPYMRIGRNVLAIASNQTSIGEPPVVTVRGSYTLADGEHRLAVNRSWRCHTVFEEKGYWWLSDDTFQDEYWNHAEVIDCPLRAPVRQPPRAIREPDRGRWITPAALGSDATAGVRRDFDIAGRPRQAWLRLTATGSYRLALNGTVIDEQEDELGTEVPAPPVQRIYDITPLTHRGSNTVALLLTGTAGSPHLLADLEVEDDVGQRVRLGSDEGWASRPGTPADWLDDVPDWSAGWQACYVEPGFLDVLPWQPRREFVEITLPPSLALRAAAGQLAVIFGIGLVTLGACAVAGRLLARLRRSGDRAAPAPVVYLALLPAALGLGGAVLATYDPRLARQDVYQPIWVLLALASVPLQWGLVALLAVFRPAARSDALLPPRAARQRLVAALATGGVLAGLLAACFWLRFRHIDLEPLHPDEWFVYQATQGVFARYFPSLQIHPDCPPSYVSTSELVFYGTALANLVFQQSYQVVRYPSLCWGLLTTVLLYVMGRQLFRSRVVGLIAAALYAFAPLCVQMCNFGRYYSQLQFFTLLTVYLFWLTLRGTGPIDRRALWGTAFAFVAAYLSWEAAGLVAVGMILAALVQRRGRLGTMLLSPAVWAALLTVLAVILLQYAHRELQQYSRLWYGTGDSDVTLMPMWRYPIFQPLHFIWESSWSPDGLLPMLGLLAAGLLTIRHAYRRPARFVLLTYLATTGILAFFLPLKLFRYAYWQTPLLILAVAAALGAGTQALARLAGPWALPGWRAYARGLAALAVTGLVIFGSGSVIELPQLDRWRTSGYRLNQLKFPHTKQAVDFLRAHYRPGDVVLANLPHVVDHYWPEGKTDYWLQTKLSLQAALGDDSTMPLHKYGGTDLVSDLPALQHVLDKNRRVWYITVPKFHIEVNEAEVSAYVLQHMDVVYEDFEALVLFHDTNNRSAAQRLLNQKVLNSAKANFLP